MKETRTIKRIAVLTSGGDAPGMNPAIRAIVRTANNLGIEVYGIKQGFQGLVENKFVLLNKRSVANILQKGGTILQTSRYPEFVDRSVRALGILNLLNHGIDGLIVIGGNGSYQGAACLAKEAKGQFQVLGIPATIDNDIYGTYRTIGFSTTLNFIAEYLDRIRDTASSHNRVFIVQAMGRKCGDLAEYAGLACGAEEIITPDKPYDLKAIAKRIKQNNFLSDEERKSHHLIIVAEGIKDKNGKELQGIKAAQYIQKQLRKLGIEAHCDDVGYAQRGGSPSVEDRILGTRMASFGVHALIAGIHNKAISLHRNDTLNTTYSLTEACKPKGKSSSEYAELAIGLAS